MTVGLLRVAIANSVDIFDRNTLVPIAIVIEGGLLLVAGVIGWLIGRPIASQFAWNGLQAAVGLLATIPLVVAVLLSLQSNWPPLARFRRLVEGLIVPIFVSCTWFDLAVISLAAGTGEEALFRGIIQTSLANHMNVIAAICLTSIAFGLAHAISIEYFVLATLVGIYLGWLWYVAGNLLVPMIVHGLYDFVVLLILTRKGSGQSIGSS
jgi:membrane protease YdiL (CAAX protease family)